MNAKELAGSISRFVGQIKPTNNPSDDAVIKGFPEWFIEDLENSATMLRQQADRIAELEKLVSDMAYEKASGVYDRPQTKHEPVAWGYISADGGIYDCISPEEHARVEGDYKIPLYTHPAKTLTDEEIWDFINGFCTDMGDYWDLNEKNAIPMIKAILRKAQEK
jgi:hypothetical protein